MKKTLVALTVGALAFGAYAEFKKNPDAKKFDTLSHIDVLNK